MPTYTAPANGGTVIGSGSGDTINGSANADIIYGRGGNDFIEGGSGNDTIYGDGSVTFAQAFAANGYAVSPYTGVALGLTGLSLSSMGVASGQSVWRVRNSTTSEQTVVLQSTSQGNGNNGGVSIVIKVPAGSDFFIPSSNVGNHKLFLNGQQVSAVKVLGDTAFDLNGQVGDGVAGNDTINGGDGNDTIYGNGGNDTINGGNGDDTIDGGDGNDSIYGGPGLDNIIGGAGNDALSGDDDADFMDGGTGNDILHGGAGNDVMTGNFGTDQMYGEDGDDVFLAEWDEGQGDYYHGGSGTDTYRVGGTVVENYALYIDLALGTSQYHDTFISIENLIGGTNADKFQGDEGANGFWGGGGNDILEGRGGDDALYGGAGDDVLAGGTGADYLDGGDGIDMADYTSSSEGVYVDLFNGVAHGGDAEGDTLVNIENLRGSAHDDVLIGNEATTILEGGGGNDVLDYSHSLAGVIVNIKTNFAAGGFAEGDVISDFEGLRGSNAADTLTGTDGNNDLIGGGGDDTLDGGLGADELSGGDGIDLVLGGAGNDVLDGGAGNDRAEGGDGNDIVRGADGKDAVQGGLGNDMVYGDAGDDGLTGGLGGDHLDGGLGLDTAYYRKSTVAVDVSLTRGTGLYGEAQGDTLVGVESLVGSNFNDILEGDGLNNRLNGGAGADTLRGMGGNDTFLTGGGYDNVDGGAGSDTISYDDSWDYVWVNLKTGVNQYGAASRDTYVSVENVIGSAYGDKLTGDDLANKITGGAGNDTLSGNGGNDYFYEGLGNDTMTGGTGADVFVFSTAFGNDTITDFAAGLGRTDRIWFRGEGIDSMAELLANATNTAAGVVIDADALGTITLKGLTIAQLHADDFIFT